MSGEGRVRASSDEEYARLLQVMHKYMYFTHTHRERERERETNNYFVWMERRGESLPQSSYVDCSMQ